MYLVVALLVMIMIMFVGIAGITYEVTRALKDTGRNGATMTVKGSDEAIQTANTDMAVSPDGVLSTRPGVGRRSDGSRREGCVNGTCPLVVMAAQLTTEAKLSSSKFTHAVVCPCLQLTDLGARRRKGFCPTSPRASGVTSAHQILVAVPLSRQSRHCTDNFFSLRKVH